MFGLFRGRTSEYRQAYARCCRMQHRAYGIDTLPFLSYEGVLVYLWAQDIGVLAGLPETAPRCCRLMTSRRDESAPDAAWTRFAASLGMLLASVKLNDDIQDDRSLIARMAHWHLKRRLERARRYFQSLDANFTETVDQYLSSHAALEASASSMDIEEYCSPTAGAFGYVYSLAAGLSPSLAEQQRSQLHEFGRCVGSTIIAVDCVLDWEADRRRGRFNPLTGRRDRIAALEFARGQLDRARDLEGGSPRSSRHVADVMTFTGQRVESMLKKEAGTSCAVARQGRRWAISRLNRAGVCDGCDIACVGCDACVGAEGCAGCDVCGALSCEGGSVCADSGICCFECVPCESGATATGSKVGKQKQVPDETDATHANT